MVFVVVDKVLVLMRSIRFYMYMAFRGIDFCVYFFGCYFEVCCNEWVVFVDGGIGFDVRVFCSKFWCYNF